MPKPKARERHCGGNSLPNAASSTMNEQPERPKPISTPAETSSSRRASRVRHQRKAGGIQQRAGAQHPAGAEAVGDNAGERLADAPQQILQRQGEGEDVAAPMIGGRQRGEKKAERRARPKRHQRDQAAGADDHRRRAPACRSVCVDVLSCRPGNATDSKKPRSIRRRLRSPKRKLLPDRPAGAWLLRRPAHGIGTVCHNRPQRLWICRKCRCSAPDAFLSPLEIEAAVTRALEEDLGRAGDITSIATVPEDTHGRAALNARASRRDRRPAAGRRGVPPAVARHRDRPACARRRPRSRPAPS